MYCGRPCQKAHWPTHKRMCKAIVALSQASLRLAHSDWDDGRRFADVADLLEEISQRIDLDHLRHTEDLPGEQAYEQIQKGLQLLLEATHAAQSPSEVDICKQLYIDRVPWLLRRRALTDLQNHILSRFSIDLLETAEQSGIITPLQDRHRAFVLTGADHDYASEKVDEVIISCTRLMAHAKNHSDASGRSGSVRDGIEAMCKYIIKRVTDRQL